MSTNATITDLAVKPTSVTYALISITEGDKTTLKATQNTKQIEKAKAEGTLLLEQSLSYDLPGTVEGISQLSIPDEEIVTIFRQGLVAKINRGIVALLEETDEAGNPAFQPVEGNYDARSIATEISGRVRLTDTEKAFKVLKNLDPSVLAQFMASLQAQKSPEQAG